MKKLVLVLVVILAGFVFISCGDDDSSPETTNHEIIPGEMVSVEGGTFNMVDPDDNQVTVSVTISNFKIGKYEVTQKEWLDIMGSNPADDNDIGDNFPVYHISWFNILAYCNKRSAEERLTPCYSISNSTNPADWGSIPVYYTDASFPVWNAVECNWLANGYRLPTESEWEYAARGGVNWADDYQYSGSNAIDDVAWYSENSASLQSIGTKKANQLSIYDMTGNLFEFCWDWYAPYTNNVTDPIGAGSGEMRSLRGGAWSHSDGNAIIAGRYREYPNSVFNYNGFRVVTRP